jgi:hypothetical protein
MIIRILTSLTAIAACFAGTSVSGQEADLARLVQDFKGFRVLAWTFDRSSGEARGFAQGEVEPGKSVTLETSPGKRVTFAFGDVRSIMRSRFGKPVSVPVVELVVSSPDIGDQVQQPLDRAYIGPMFDRRSTWAGVAVSIPKGSIQSPALAKLLDSKPKGEMAGLEDLLLAAARDQQIDAMTLTDIYGLITRSQRLGQWIELSKDPAPEIALPALSAAARLGDSDSIKRFCQICLSTEGNAQLRLIDLLEMMDPCDEILGTSLLLASLPEPRLQPEPGSSAMDPRFTIALRMNRQYSPETIQARAKALIESAKPQERADMESRMAAVMARLERLRNPPTRPARAPASQTAPRSNGDAAQ